MFSYISYAILAFLAALVVTVFGVAIRPLKARDEQRPGRTFLIWFIIALVLPYVVAEALSRTVGKQMSSAISSAYDQADFKGPMLYYKVILFTGSKAKALAIGQEKQDWGGMDRPVISINLEKQNNKWTVKDYKVILSDRLNKDGIVLPPYW